MPTLDNPGHSSITSSAFAAPNENFAALRMLVGDLANYLRKRHNVRMFLQNCPSSMHQTLFSL
jgi:hypothetical protein